MSLRPTQLTIWANWPKSHWPKSNWPNSNWPNSNWPNSGKGQSRINTDWPKSNWPKSSILGPVWWGRRGFTRQPESPNVHISGPRPSKTPTKFNARTPRERKKKENCGGRMEKKERNSGRSGSAVRRRAVRRRAVRPHNTHHNTHHTHNTTHSTQHTTHTHTHTQHTHTTAHTAHTAHT